MAEKISSKKSTTFAEYVLHPGLTKKEHVPDKVSLKTPLVKFEKGEDPEFYLNMPFTSAVMQSVSGSELAIALAKEGGLGFIYASQPIEKEAEMVEKVKDFKAGFVVSKVNLTSEHTLEDAVKLTEETEYSTIPITKDGKNNSELLGILTDQDYWQDYDPLNIKLGKLMTSFKDLKYGLTGITLNEANQILRESKKSCIPIINNETEKLLKYLVFKKDREQHKKNPLELIDSEKRLLVGAGINTRDYKERVPALIDAGVDILVIDTSDAHSEWVKDTLEWVKTNYSHIPIGAGNIVTKEAFRYLADAGADFIKIGLGGGSICITQEVKGIGRGQATAVLDVAVARQEYFEEKGIYIPICSDGGLAQDSHILISLAMGADFLMMGRYFARCEESPTEKKILTGEGLMKPYWGEGSDRAKNWQRYQLGEEKKLSFEEGVDGWVPFAGDLKDIVRASLAVMKATMCNLGCLNIKELHENALLEQRSPASIREGKPHDITYTDSLGVYKNIHWGNT